MSTFASSGAGLDLLGARLWYRRKVRRYAWYTESNPTAQKAHAAFWGALGQRPKLVHRVDDWELQRVLRRADVETITLRCAPFSPKHRRYPKGCWAAIREAAIAMAGAKRRRPRVIIYENTAGLWQRRALKWRQRVERLLRGLRRYRWEAIRTSPHWHSGCPQRRDRIFYVGIRITRRA